MDVGSSSFFIYIYIEYDILPLYYYYYHIHKSSTYKCDTQKNKNSEREAMSTTDFLRCPKPYTPNARVRVGYVARDIRILALLFLFPSNLPSFLSTSPLLLSPRTVFCPPCIPPPGFQQFLPFPLLTENEPEAHPWSQPVSAFLAARQLAVKRCLAWPCEGIRELISISTCRILFVKNLKYVCWAALLNEREISSFPCHS